MTTNTDAAPSVESSYIHCYISMTEQAFQEARESAEKGGFKKIIDIEFSVDGVKYSLSYAELKALLASKPATVPKRGRMSRQEKIDESRAIVAARLQRIERTLTDEQRVSWEWLDRLAAPGLYLDRLGPIRDYVRALLNAQLAPGAKS